MNQNTNNVDVLAVMDFTVTELVDARMGACADQLVEARDAVRELILEFRQLLDDCDASGVTEFSRGKGFDESIERARAALARVGGGK